MVRFWTSFIEPFARALRPQRIMEIGPGRGAMSRPLLAYCRETGCRAELIDPKVSPELLALMAEASDQFRLHGGRAIDVIPEAEHPDLVLIDGDPNWWSVFNELSHLVRLSQSASRPFPCVMVHNVGWPYGRRDMYHEPAEVPVKLPFAYMGVRPGRPGLAADGVNARFAHALTEGGARNGVLTAVEDFIESTPLEFTTRRLTFFNGLSILVPAERMTEEVKAAMDDFQSPERLRAACEALETERLAAEAALAELRFAYERRTAALARARELLAAREAQQKHEKAG